jgi:lipopolysaccharide transport system ATP-binding protein
MSDAAVVFDGVWKKFRRGERHDSLRDFLPSLVKGALSRPKPGDLERREFWALRDVAFDVRHGEALGVIGPNGAGKSTVLKLLTKILKPTRGQCSVRGRVGSLIEVAAGFHPDLTGRENIFLQAAIMGMKRAEIARKLDQVVDFAGVGEFIDTPIKRYSSGMNARLGFSIAAHLDPDVLLIDEVLAVGDRAFQERCYARMRHFCDSGVAIVLISHNLSAIASLCKQTLVLRGGEVQTLGATQESLAAYARLMQPSDDACARPGEAVVEVLTPSLEPVSTVNAGDQLLVRSVVKVDPFDGTLAWAIRIRRVESGEVVFFTTSPSLGSPSLPWAGSSVIETHWQFTANLARGLYSIELVFFNRQTRDAIIRLSQAAQFAVQEAQSEEGVVYLGAQTWSTAVSPATAVAGPPIVERHVLA